MSWLSSHLKMPSGGVKGALSNALKNFAPAAFLVPGVGPELAALVGGAGSAVGQGLSRHPSLGGALKAGITGAATGYGGASLAGGQGYQGIGSAIKGAFVPSSAATQPSAGYLSGNGIQGSAPTSLFGAGDAGGPAVSSAGLGGSLGSALPSAQVGAGAANAAGSQPSFLSRAGSFAEHNPTAVAMGLQGVGAMESAGSANEANRAMARRTQAETDTVEAERKRKAAQDAALEPLRRALAGEIGNLNANQYKPAPNPYFP